jgi:signal transduction histidine kinase
MTDALPRVLDFGLLANFVHQVINPLNGVSGTLDNIIDGTISDERRPQRLRAAKAQLEHCIMLVRNLAYFSQISLDPTNVNPGKIRKTCVIPQTIIEAAQFFQELGAARGIKIHLDDRVTQYRVEGNPDLLRQIFMNLFDNAVKYGASNTTIAVKAWVQKSTNNLLITVTTLGVELQPGEDERIFELGYRGSQAQSRVASGTGLGLYICRVIMGAIHNGTVTVERVAGGLSFMLRFPIYFIEERDRRN